MDELDAKDPHGEFALVEDKNGERVPTNLYHRHEREIVYEGTHYHHVSEDHKGRWVYRAY